MLTMDTLLRLIGNIAMSTHYQIPFQCLTIDVRRVPTYVYFHWRMHDFGQAHVDMYAKFFPYDFLFDL